MAPKYKLSYFTATGIAEPIRFLLSYGSADFEDHRFSGKEWPKLKANFPFGKVPALEVDGKQAYQSVAICRYLAKQLNLLGNNDWDAAQIDSIVDAITDLRVQLVSYFYDPNETSKAAKWEPLQKETIPFYLSRFENTVKENGGYLVGGQLTWADLYFVALIPCLERMAYMDLVKNHPNLKNLKEKVEAIPQIKAWIAKRPPDNYN